MPKKLTDDYDEEDDDPRDLYDDGSDAAFERWYQSQLVSRKCHACGAHFMGMPDHGYCDSCADKIEQGWDIG